MTYAFDSTATTATREIPSIYFDPSSCDRLFATNTGRADDEYIAQFGGYFVLGYWDVLFDMMVAYDLPAFASLESAQAYADKRRDQFWGAKFNKMFDIV